MSIALIIRRYTNVVFTLLYMTDLVSASEVTTIWRYTNVYIIIIIIIICLAGGSS